jgi:hypothetical protein
MKAKTAVVLIALTSWAGWAAGFGSPPDTVRLRLRIPQGLKTEVAGSGLFKLSVENRLKAWDQPETSIPDQHTSSWKKKYSDVYALVEAGRPKRIVRHTESDTRTAKSPQSGKMETEDTPAKDSTVTLTRGLKSPPATWRAARVNCLIGPVKYRAYRNAAPSAKASSTASMKLIFLRVGMNMRSIALTNRLSLKTPRVRPPSRMGTA